MCRLTKVRATVEVKYVVPPGEQKDLREHQRVHAHNAADTARYIVSELQGLPPKEDCDAAGAAANAEANQELDAAHERDRVFDETR